MAAQLMNLAVKNDFHLGHILLSTFKSAPENICQLDAATGEKETNGSVLSRSIKLARSLRKLGLKPGDVLVISGNNHLDIHIPYYAAFFNGLPICGVDCTFKYGEIGAKRIGTITEAKFAAKCDSSEKPAHGRAPNIHIVAEARSWPLAAGGVIHIPYYAAFFNGLPICGVDCTFKYDEVKNVLNIVLPKVAFCDSANYEIFKQVVKDLNLDTTVIKFGKGENSMNEFVDKYDENTPIEDFKVAEVDIESVYLWLPTTSGTTGSVKVAAIKQAGCVHKFKIYLQSMATITRAKPSAPGGISLNVAPIHWLTGVFNAMALPLLRYCKVQTSAPITADHLIDIINEYKPQNLLTSPALLTSILNSPKHCDFSCFNLITLTGSKLRREVYDEITSRLKEGSCIVDMYGSTESLGPIMCSDPFGPRNAFVLPTPSYELKLVDPNTGKEITEPLVHGELFWRGPGFTCYYRNPEETQKAMAEDGWVKTGDILYKDEAGRFYYVERLKTLIKYRSYHVVPAELEELIRQHPGVREVVVTAVPHDTDSEHPVACVVKQNGAQITAREIIDLVAEKLSDSKKLRGGVIFLDEIPTTSTGKVALRKLKQIVLDSNREL